MTEPVVAEKPAEAPVVAAPAVSKEEKRVQKAKREAEIREMIANASKVQKTENVQRVEETGTESAPEEKKEPDDDTDFIQKVLDLHNEGKDDIDRLFGK